MFMSMGMVLQIPLAAVADMVFHGEKTTAVLAAGYALIVAGFVLLAVEQRRLALHAVTCAAAALSHRARGKPRLSESYAAPAQLGVGPETAAPSEAQMRAPGLTAAPLVIAGLGRVRERLDRAAHNRPCRAPVEGLGRVDAASAPTGAHAQTSATARPRRIRHYLRAG